MTADKKAAAGKGAAAKGGGAAGAAKAAGLTGLQKGLLATFSVLLLGSVLVRASTAPDHSASPAGGTASAPAGSTSLIMPTGTAEGAAGEQTQGLEQYLPYVTEASFFGLIGFALGYTTRKIFKILLILIALAFVGTQVGVQAGWFEVDWDSVLAKLNDWVFNLKEHATVTDFLTDRVPSAASLLVGWLVGFKRG